MTAGRQKRWRGKALGLFLGLTVASAACEARAATPEQLVVNPNTGLAISGFDPVAYFTEAAPEQGQTGFELNVAGTIWRFRNEGNRAAFEKHPEVYAPRFGGYDPVAVARGVSVAGHPLFWFIVGERLYLFYSAEARATFTADPGRYIEAAERKWPEVALKIGH